MPLPNMRQNLFVIKVENVLKDISSAVSESEKKDYLHCLKISSASLDSVAWLQPLERGSISGGCAERAAEVPLIGSKEQARFFFPGLMTGSQDPRWSTQTERLLCEAAREFTSDYTLE